MSIRLGLLISFVALGFDPRVTLAESRKDPKVKLSAQRGLDWLVGEQHRQGFWEANQGQYRVAMTALAGNAMLCEGSTTTRGKYAKNISDAVDYLWKPQGIFSSYLVLGTTTQHRRPHQCGGVSLQHHEGGSKR